MLNPKPFQALFIDPLIRTRFFRTWHPNFATFLGLAFGVSILPLLQYGYNHLAIAFLFFSGFFDLLDGPLARIKQQVTPRGAALDITSDRFVEFAVILGLFLFTKQALPTIILLGSVLICVTTFLVVGIFADNGTEKSFYYSPGLMERFEAFVFFALMMGYPTLYAPLAYLSSGLIFLTALIRLAEFARYPAFSRSE